MSYQKARSKVTVWQPGVDGRLSRLGIGQSMMAIEPKKEDRKPEGSSVSEDTSQVHWNYGQYTRYIPQMRAIAPKGYVQPVPDTPISEFDVHRGSWHTAHRAGSLWHESIWFSDGKANHIQRGADGVVTTSTTLWPNFAFWYWFGPIPEQHAEKSMFRLQFRGGDMTGGYQITVPHPEAIPRDVQDSDGSSSNPSWRVPTLWGNSGAVGAEWSVIDHMDKEDYQGAGGSRTFKRLTVETDGSWLLVQFENSLWAYNGAKWRDKAGRVHSFNLDECLVDIGVTGCTFQFCMERLEYPPATGLVDRSTDGSDEPVTAKPREWVTVDPTIYVPTPTYYFMYRAPEDTSISVTQDDDSTTAKERPVVEFSNTDKHKFAALFGVHDVHESEFTTPPESPTTISSCDNPAFQLVSASGFVTEDYRGATFQATIEAAADQTVQIPQTNSKIQAAVQLLDSSEGHTSYDEQVWRVMFTGYTLPSTRREVGKRVGAAIHHVEAQTLDEARLAKKPMGWHCRYDDWPVDQAFTTILNLAGVHDDLISIDPTITEASMGDAYYLPGGSTDKPAFGFAPDADVVEALDKIADARNLQWGINPLGAVFLQPQPTYGGTPDFVLDDASADASDAISSAEAATTPDDFINLLQVVTGVEPNRQGIMLIDVPSIATDSADDFLGDVWAKYVVDDQADDANRLAAQVWSEHHRYKRTLVWETQFHAGEIKPGDYVEVSLDDLDIPDGTIYKVISLRWKVTEHGKSFSQRIACVHEEDASS